MSDEKKLPDEALDDVSGGVTGFTGAWDRVPGASHLEKLQYLADQSTEVAKEILAGDRNMDPKQ